MPKSFYRKSNKLYPENWEYDIKEHEKRIKDPEKYLLLDIVRFFRKKDEEEKALLDCDGNYCGHKRKTEFEGKYVCLDCGRELGKIVKTKNNVGYNHSNHTMRSSKK